jgi:hypothetical protein
MHIILLRFSNSILWNPDITFGILWRCHYNYRNTSNSVLKLYILEPFWLTTDNLPSVSTRKGIKNVCFSVAIFHSWYVTESRTQAHPLLKINMAACHLLDYKYLLFHTKLKDLVNGLNVNSVHWIFVIQHIIHIQIKLNT